MHSLERGGYVIVMRHASSPSEPPAKESADAENTRDERQLSSPAYRALETVKYAQLGTARSYAELGDNGKSMQGGTEAQAHWLQNKVTQFHPARTGSSSPTIPISRLRSRRLEFPSPMVRRWCLDRAERAAQPSLPASRLRNGPPCDRMPLLPSLISLWQYHRKYGILMWHSHRSA